MTAKPVPEHISDERLAEIIKGCEGVTPGPWQRVEPGAGSTLVECHNGTICEVQWNRPDVGNAHRDAAHIARLDPQTVLSVLTELQHRREAEAVAWRWRYDDPAAPGKKLGWFFGPIEPPPNALGRSWSGWECEPLYAASPSSPASGVRVKVKPLEWRESETGEAVIADGLTYVVALDLDERGEAYRLFVGSGPDPIGYFNTEGEAKAAAQAHYLSALGEHP